MYRNNSSIVRLATALAVVLMISLVAMSLSPQAQIAVNSADGPSEQTELLDYKVVNNYQESLGG